MAFRIQYWAVFFLADQLTQVLCLQYSENGEGLSIPGTTVRLPTGNALPEYPALDDYRAERYSDHADAESMRIAYMIVGVFSLLCWAIGICCFCSKGRRKVTAGYVISDPNQGTTSASAEPQKYIPDQPPAYSTQAMQQHPSYTPSAPMQP